MSPTLTGGAADLTSQIRSLTGISSLSSVLKVSTKSRSYEIGEGGTIRCRGREFQAQSSTELTLHDCTRQVPNCCTKAGVAHSPAVYVPER